MHNIERNSKSAISLEPFKELNYPLSLGEVELDVPDDRIYILRMPIRSYHSGFQIPEELKWCRPLIAVAEVNQKKMKVNHPFCYITIRSGLVTSTTDDEWHVDGFSTKITHLPEQNYIWVDRVPTEWTVQGINFPEDFDPLVHNVHRFIQRSLRGNVIQTCEPKRVYCMDPYVIHRRPHMYEDVYRTFIRVSFTPIEIQDRNNTFNDLLPMVSNRDGVMIRDQLKDYHEEKLK